MGFSQKVVFAMYIIGGCWYIFSKGPLSSRKYMLLACLTFFGSHQYSRIYTSLYVSAKPPRKIFVAVDYPDNLFSLLSTFCGYSKSVSHRD